MYSQSNSFLGGANSARPGAGQFGQQSFNSFQPSNPSPFTSQPTGYGGQQLQAQATGYPGFQQQNYGAPPQQPQATGYPGYNQQQPSFNQSQSGFGQQQQYQQPQQQQPLQQQTTQAAQSQSLQPPAQPLRPQQTSAQIAASFSQSSSVIPPPPPKDSAPRGGRIPAIRLSFLTATDQAKFEQLFKSAAGSNQALEGDKAKDLLLRSKLPGQDLSQIWILSDTTKSGQLLFPEFALAMYLCNLKLTGQSLPAVLPEKVRNEVSSMVDIISFGVADDQPSRSAAPSRSNVPDFDAPLRQNAVSPPAPQQPTPQQPNNQQLLNHLTAQPTGFYNAAMQRPGMQPQPTGFPGPQGFQPPNQGLQPQATGFMQNPQATGYNGPRPPMPPMPTGMQQGLSPSQTGMPIQAQPTGLPGQWGFVNAPATGLPNIEALKNQLMPQQGREQGYTTSGLTGTAKIPWAITKDEKKIYDDLFNSWDGMRRGFINGDTAIEIMGQSGLDRKDLEATWTLSDPQNRGRLNKDEFAVAMHLIYRKLNGYPVPARLPPELIPPSARNIDSSIDTVRSMLKQDAESRKQSGAFLQPQRTGVSYLKTHSFRTGSPGAGGAVGRKDATVFRNNDEDVGYRSSARRRLGAGGRTPSPAQGSEMSDDSRYDDLTPDQIRKRIREKRILLDAADFSDERQQEDDDVLDRRDRREAEDLFRQIRQIQDDIDTHPNSSLGATDTGAEKRSLRRELQRYQDRIPALASDVRKVEKDIGTARLELFRLKDAKAHPGGASSIIGTGPGGQVTEADRIKARARARMQARAAELSGRPAPQAEDEGTSQRRLEQERTNIRTEQEKNEGMTRDVEDSVKDFVASLEDGLRDETSSSTNEHERRRWEEALGVEDEVRELIYDLQRSSRTARVRKEEASRPGPQPTPSTGSQRDIAPTNGGAETRPAPPSQTASSSSLTSGTSHQDRVASAKERALKRIQDRMAAAGLKPADSGESAQQRQEREKRERDERVRKAQEEDERREQERQARLAGEGVSGPAPTSPKPAGKKPPPPAPRKGRQDSVDQSEKARVEADAAKELHAEQKAQQAERQQLEYVRPSSQVRLSLTHDRQQAAGQEDDLEKERRAADERLRALEEQVRQGKLKKAEEKAKKKAAEREAKEKEDKLAKRRAEIEAARERERQLQMQLEAMGDDSSSDDEGPAQHTPQDSSVASLRSPPTHAADPTSAPLPPPMPTIAPPVPASDFSSKADTPLTSPPPQQESKNPYFRKMSEASQASQPAFSPPPVPTAQPFSPPAHKELPSTNPFAKLAQQEAAKPLAPTMTSGPVSRRRQEESDDWSAAGSDKEESDDEDAPTGGSAKQLASLLFGSMAPPRPLSAMDSKPQTPTAPTEQARQETSPPSAAAPAPPMPGSFGESMFDAPSAPPPPPPPMPASGAPGSPPPPPPMPGMGAPVAPPPPPPGAAPMPKPAAGGIGALLGDISKGKPLRKAQTNDRSTSSAAGRVLD